MASSTGTNDDEIGRVMMIVSKFYLFRKQKLGTVILYVTHQIALTIKLVSTIQTNFVFIHNIRLSSSILYYKSDGNAFIKVFDKIPGSFINVSQNRQPSYDWTSAGILF
jgi:hypothetical protein